MPTPLQTRVTELLGCDHPILQTGMGWVAEPPLVAAACNAGAFGFLAAFLTALRHVLPGELALIFVVA